VNKDKDTVVFTGSSALSAKSQYWIWHWCWPVEPGWRTLLWLSWWQAADWEHTDVTISRNVAWSHQPPDIVSIYRIHYI